jgi:bifunctional non-homologous end joining protein LigD
MVADRAESLLSLERYREKRSFERTPEPQGGGDNTGGELRFVVHKHAASRLHYDLRLELDGVLKSWAVPKGPSLDPKDKHLAIMVEDHPLEYRTFEGVIPEGNYGAGTVMRWDEGLYHDRGAHDGPGEEGLRRGIEKGHLTLVLAGKKLKGEFALVKLKRGKENEWLLIKKDDEFASHGATAPDERSVATGRTMEEIASRSLASGDT